MKIGILGSRGIPNEYGGFEQFAEIISCGLVEKGYDITVYCSSKHSYQEKEFKGVKLVHCNDPVDKLGTASQFIYDLNSILHARKQNYDIIYLLGYTSSSVWQRLLKNKAIVITNMDGLEWKRTKYSKKIQKFLRYAEKLAVKHSDFLVADSLGIKEYLKNKYNVIADYHPYGCYLTNGNDESYLLKYNLEPYKYDVLVARFEPENNIEMILKGFSQSSVDRDLVLVGNYLYTPFGKAMFEKYGKMKNIKFLGGIYDQKELQNIRYYSNLYFHGHSVGGTNPSLLEAMGDSAFIIYHKNPFNKAIVGEDGYAFSNAEELAEIINREVKKNNLDKINSNVKKIEEIYNWEIIINNYEKYFSELIQKKKLF